MLNNLFVSPTRPDRVVIVGAGSFVGKAAKRKLVERGVPQLGLARQDLDLLSTGASGQLAAHLREGDTLLIIAAKAPVKNNEMLLANLQMMAAVCEAISTAAVGHVIYISSDAVYADSDAPITESSCAEASSLHGVMHLAREIMLANVCKVPLCILRPTLIYGAHDPHNGYGPNRFRRLVQRGETIELFGEGEERRDHVYIDDVAELIVRCILHKSQGKLNIATGIVTSFREIADLISSSASKSVTIKTLPRSGPMPHRGYRAFDPSATLSAFSDFRYTPLQLGLKLSHDMEFLDGRD